MKSEVGSRKSEVRSWKSEVGSWKSELRSRKSELRSRKLEVALLGHRRHECFQQEDQKPRSTFDPGLAIINFQPSWPWSLGGRK